MDLDAEREMIQRCRAGEDDAWEEFFAEQYVAAGCFVFQPASNLSRGDSDEIYQEQWPVSSRQTIALIRTGMYCKIALS